MKNYRGVTLMSTAYKIYASLLNERLKAETEKKLGEGQFGFREGRGTMDAVYILNYIANRELGKRKGKLFACFIDLKAAFDWVDREELMRMMREMGVRENLRRRIGEIYERTGNVIRAEGGESEEFWTTRGVRQGCPLSPSLFNILLSDLEEYLRRVAEGGVVVGREKLWSLSYADDIVLLAVSKEGMKDMIKRMKKYLGKKGLTLSAEKTKMLVFERGVGAGMRKREWKWGEERIEEVKQVKYLGVIMQKNGRTRKHVEDRLKRATVAMKKAWSVGERIFKDSFGRRMRMFQALVESVMLFGSEIWGWYCDEKIERVKRKYVKWILGLDRNTPNYIVAEEMKSEELRDRALERAFKYEEEVRKSEKRLVKECIREIEREKTEEIKNEWVRRRKEARNRIGLEGEKVTQIREEEEGEVWRIVRKVKKRIRETRMKERVKRIDESKYNTKYKKIRTEELPMYLRGRMNKKDRSLLARFRCGNECKGGQHWIETEDRMCRICGKAEETLEHLSRGCNGEIKEGKVEELLEESGEGLAELRRIMERRRKREDKDAGKDIV